MLGMNKSLGMVIAICLAGLQFLAVLAVVFSSYISSERALIGHARDLLHDVGVNTIEHSRWFLRPAKDAAELAARLAENQVIVSEDLSQLEQFLFQQLRLASQFSGLYYGAEDGSFVFVMRSPDGPGPFRTKFISTENGARKVELVWRDADFRIVETRRDDADPYDPRTRPWFVRAKDTRETVWTDPYIFYSSQQPGITLSAPVQNTTGEVKGVVGVDIEIGMISHFLARLQIGDRGRALIINRNGDVIAHPLIDLIRTTNVDGTLRFVNIADFDDPVARTAFSAIAAGGGQVGSEAPSEFSYEGEQYVTAILPMPGEILPWTIAVYAPEDDFTAAIKRNRAMNIWIAAAVALVTGLISLALANAIHKPFRDFALRSAMLSRGEIDPNEKLPRTYHELERANAALSEQIVARQRSEAEYRQTFRLAPQGVAHVVPGSGAFIRANERFCAISGYSAGELAHMHLTDLAAPEDLPVWRSVALKDASVAVHRQIRCRRKDGEVIWVSINAILIHGQGQEPLYTVVTMDDITYKKRAEGQIQQLSRELSHLSRGNTMGQMAAGLAHELNQPLTSIAQNADTALHLLGQKPTDVAELNEILSEISQQSLRSGEIIRALRGFIMRDEGARIAFDFGMLLTQTMLLVQAEATEAGVTIETTVPADMPMLEGNRVQVAQVLVNLLRNAIEAMSTGVDTDRLVTVRATAHGRQAMIEVEDNGPGISPDIALFTQFDTSKPNGMGLGLSICRSIVEANGGTLIHDDSYVGGARFCFTLPVAREARDVTEHPETKEHLAEGADAT